MEEKLEPQFAHMVLRGRDDWLFLANDSNKSIDQITGKAALSDVDIEAWRITLQLRRAWLADMGCKYVFAVAPAKEIVYSPYLPDDLTVSEDRPVNQLRSALGPKIPFVYLPDRLAAQDRGTYSKTDTHWNDFGGYIQANAIVDTIRSLGISLPDISRLGIEFDEQEWLGDLGRKLTPPEKSAVLRKRYRRKAAGPVMDSKITNTGSLVIIENEDKTLPVGMLFGDSFAGVGSVADFVAQQFSRLYVLWQPHFDFRMIEDIRPDVVISQIAERFLVRIPDDVRSEKLSAMKGFAEKWREQETPRDKA